MSTHAIDTEPSSAIAEPVILTVPVTAPFRWLTAGLADLRAAPLQGLLYGALFAGACLFAYWLSRDLPWFTLAYLTGLLLLGPYLAAGLYVASRQIGAGERVSVRSALATIGERKTNLALYALFLGLVMAAWVRFSSLLFAFKLDLASPSIESYLGFLSGGLRGTGIEPAVLVYFVGIGFLLAAAVYVTSVVSVPMIVDRDSGPIAAIHASLQTVKRNWLPLAVWAALVVALTALGVLTYFLGLIVVFPVLGYASWHGYRAMVE